MSSSGDVGHVTICHSVDQHKTVICCGYSLAQNYYSCLEMSFLKNQRILICVTNVYHMCLPLLRLLKTVVVVFKCFTETERRQSVLPVTGLVRCEWPL